MKIKLKKNHKKGFINGRNFLVLVIIFLGLALYYHWFSLATITGQVEYTKTEVLSNTLNYIELKHTAIPTHIGIDTEVQCNDGKAKISQNIPFKPYNDDAVPLVATTENYFVEGKGWQIKGDNIAWFDYVKGKRFNIQEGYFGNKKINHLDGYCVIGIISRTSDAIVTNPTNPLDDKPKYTYYRG